MADANANASLIEKIEAEMAGKLNGEQLKALAVLTEAGDRFEHMCEVMKQLVKGKEKLSVEERNMLSVAYKNMVGQRRKSWRSFDKDEKDPLKAQYKAVIEAELRAKCYEVLGILQDDLIDEGLKSYWISLYETCKAKVQKDNGKDEKKGSSKDDVALEGAIQKEVYLVWCKDLKNSDKAVYNADVDASTIAKLETMHGTPFGKDTELKPNDPLQLIKDRLESVETLVFYLKMCGDYYRYLAELSSTEDDLAGKSEKFYKDALICAHSCLAPTHPTRLGLSLNMSVCYFEILKKMREACDLAQRAFDAAIQNLDSLSDNNYKDSTLIMQLLRDNLTIWQPECDKETTTD